MSYEYFSFLYDELMNEAPYDEWVAFLEKQKSKYHPHAKKMLDLACGTGEISLRLVEKGYDITGIDLSEEMLTVANQKASNKGHHIPFIMQDMAELEGLHDFDVVVIFCDSLNYLEKSEDVLATFQSVHRTLDENGLFLFDVHSPYKIENIYSNHTFSYNGDDISYIWNSFPGDQPLSIEHDLSFFVYDEETQKYDRYDELHKQRTFELDQYKSWLLESGFEVLSVIGDFQDEQISDTTERVFFVAKKI